MSYHGHFESQKPPKKSGKKGKKIVLIILAVLLILVAAVAAAGYFYYDHIIDKIDKVDVEKIDYAALATETLETTAAETTEATSEATTEATTVVTTEPYVPSSADYINFLVVGQAARNDETERFADTMMLCTLNTHEKTLTMTSMLRDTLIRGTNYKGKNYGGIKLTTVYHLGYQWGGGVAGSMEMMNQTLFLNFGIEVDHNFEVDFDAFIEIINQLGGVEIELTQAEADYLNADDFWVYHDVSAGLTKLTGMPALSYARMRKAEGDNESDIARTERQRKLISAVIQKLKTKSLSELQAMVDAVLPYITTSMTKEEITDMLVKVLPMVAELEIINGGSCPQNTKGELYDIYGDGMMHSILRFNEYDTKKYMRAITEGEIAE